MTRTYTLDELEYATGYEKMYGITDEQFAYLAQHQSNLQRFESVPTYDDRLNPQLDMLARKLDQLKSHGFEAVNETGSAFDAIRIDFVHTTTQLEGNTLSRAETAMVIEQDLPIPEKPLHEQLEVVDAARAFDYARKAAQDGAPFTEELVLELHRLGAASLEEADPGEYRWDMRYVSASSVFPPPPKRVAELMKQLVETPLAENPIVNAALTHLVFEDIHPFGDGNGRTGRALLNYQILTAGYPPIAFKADQANARRYYDAISTFVKDFENRDGTALVKLTMERVNEELDKRLSSLHARIEHEQNVRNSLL